MTVGCPLPALVGLLPSLAPSGLVEVARAVKFTPAASDSSAGVVGFCPRLPVMPLRPVVTPVVLETPVTVVLATPRLSLLIDIAPPLEVDTSSLLGFPYGLPVIPPESALAAGRPALFVGAVLPLPYIGSPVIPSVFLLTLVAVTAGVVCCLPVVVPLAAARLFVDGPGVAVDSFAPPGVVLREVLLASGDPPASPSNVRAVLAGGL